MLIKKTYSFRNGAKVLFVEDWAGPTRYSGTIRYFVVVDPDGVDQGHEYDRWEDARQEALSY